MTDTFSYHILTKEQVHEMKKQSYAYHYSLAVAFVENHPEMPDFFKEDKTLRLITALLIFCSFYNFDTKTLFENILMQKNFKDLKLFFKELKQTINQKKETENIIIKKGLIQKLIHGTKNPPIFNESTTLYIKIDDIETIIPLENLVNKAVKRLNLYTPLQYQLTSQKESHTTHYKKRKGIIQNTKRYQFFILKSKQKIKIGRFLSSYIEQIETLEKALCRFSTEEFDKFINLFYQKQLSEKDRNKLLKKTFPSDKIHLSDTLFFEICAYKHLSQEELITYLSDIKNIYKNYAKQIHESQIKTAESTKTDANLTGDTLVLSVNPIDIARMSEYTDWESCMSQDGDFCNDISLQIGIGSIIVYIINHKNPYKRLGRILFKPYVSQEDSEKIFNLVNYFFTTHEKKYRDFDKLCSHSFEILQKRWSQIYTDFKDILPDNKIDIKNTVYLADKAYGINNSFFPKIAQFIINNILIPKDTYGIFYQKAHYHSDILPYNQYFVNPADPNRLKKYLKDNKIFFSTITVDNNEYIYFKRLYIPHILHLDLSGVRASDIETNADTILQIDNRCLKTNHLTIIDAEKIAYFPENITTKSLTLKGRNLISLPHGIKTKKLKVYSNTLKIIPTDIGITELDISETSVCKLPPLKLTALLAAKTKLSDISHLEISEYLDLSHTPIQHLPRNLSLKYLLLKNCTQLTKLPPELKTEYLDIGKTKIKKIPAGFYSSIILNHNQLLKQFLPGTNFLNLEAQYSGLTHLPDNLKAEKINLKNSSIQNLPNGLSANTVIVDHTDIHTLPYDIKVKTLSAKHTKIEDIPSNLQVQFLTLTDTPVKVIHYSSNIVIIHLDKTPKFIHPSFKPFNFPDLKQEDVLKAQENYRQYFGIKTKVASQSSHLTQQSQKESLSKEKGKE